MQIGQRLAARRAPAGPAVLFGVPADGQDDSAEGIALAAPLHEEHAVDGNDVEFGHQGVSRESRILRRARYTLPSTVVIDSPVSLAISFSVRSPPNRSEIASRSSSD